VLSSTGRQPERKPSGRRAAWSGGPTGWTPDDQPPLHHSPPGRLSHHGRPDRANRSLGLVEVDKDVSCQIEVVTATATLTTAALRLSSMAHVWLSGAVFELSGAEVVQ